MLVWLGLGLVTESQGQINQQTNIQLKNGVKIHGAILESIDNEYLKNCTIINIII